MLMFVGKHCRAVKMYIQCLHKVTLCKKKILIYIVQHDFYKIKFLTREFFTTKKTSKQSWMKMVYVLQQEQIAGRHVQGLFSLVLLLCGIADLISRIEEAFRDSKFISRVREGERESKILYCASSK